MDPSVPFDLEDLLAQSGWARQLAINLVHDPDRADDLVQEAWRRTLEHPPRTELPGDSARGWLATVMRNLARTWKRDSQLRSWHETRASRPEAWSPESTEDRVVLQRRLAEAVLDLPEPYRTAISLRYFEGLSLREVARRQKISYDAARQRISRGLALLRAGLDRKYGDDRSAWCAVIVGSLSRSFPTWRWSPLLPKGLLMSINVKLAGGLAVVFVLLSALVWKSFWTQSPPPQAALIAQNAAALAPIGKDIASTPIPAGDREAVLEEQTQQEQPQAIDRDHDLHGRVLDPSSNPIAGAAIEVYRNELSEYGFRDEEHMYDRALIAKRTTDSQGRFVVALPIGRPFLLEVSAPGYAIERMNNRYAGECVTVGMHPAAAIFGRVTSASDGAPIRGAELMMERTGEKGPYLMLPPVTCATDELGRYRFEGLAPAWVLIQVHPTAEAPVRKQWRGIEIGEGCAVELDFNVDVIASGTLLGRVIDASTRAPIAGARVSGLLRSASTDATGQYSLASVAPEGMFEVSARADGYFEQVRSLDHQPGTGFPERADFELRSAGRARGRVVDADGRPVADAYVAAVALHAPGETKPGSWQSARSTADGSFEIHGVDPEVKCALIAKKDGFGTTAYFLPADAVLGPRVEFGDVVLRPMSVIRGRVVDESGKGIPDQQVNLHESPGDCLPHAWEMPRSVEEHVVFNVASDRTARTDDLGRFSFADLTAGSYFLELNSIYGPTTARWPLVSVQEGETLEDVQIILPGDLSIEGRVVDGQGRAVPKARVFVNAEIEGKRGSNALERTDTEGRFSVHHLPPGQYSVLIAPSLWNLKGEPESAFAPRKVKGVGAGTRGLEIKVGAAGWIKGRVLDSDGHYVVHAPVIITIRGDDIQTMSPTDAQGRFEFPIGEGEIADLEAQPPDVLRQEDRTDATTGRSKCARVGGVGASETEILIKLP